MLGTPENFGYMSGAIKDFFERIYYPLLDETPGLPYALFVKASTDGDGAVRSVERIVAGLRWKLVMPPIVVVGDLGPDDLERARSSARPSPPASKPACSDAAALCVLGGVDDRRRSRARSSSVSVQPAAAAFAVRLLGLGRTRDHARDRRAGEQPRDRELEQRVAVIAGERVERLDPVEHLVGERVVDALGGHPGEARARRRRLVAAGTCP